MAVALSATFSGDYNLFNEINEFLNILQSIQLPFAMLPVLHFASSADLLGRFRSSTTMLVRFSQSRKAALPIEVTLAGMVTLVSSAQPGKE